MPIFLDCPGNFCVTISRQIYQSALWIKLKEVDQLSPAWTFTGPGQFFVFGQPIDRTRFPRIGSSCKGNLAANISRTLIHAGGAADKSGIAVVDHQIIIFNHKSAPSLAALLQARLYYNASLFKHAAKNINPGWQARRQVGEKNQWIGGNGFHRHSVLIYCPFKFHEKKMVYPMKPGLVVSLLVMLVMPLVGMAQSPQYEEGTHYIELPIPITNRDPSKVEVTEYFSYGCPHCFEFDSTIQSWARNLASDVRFNRTPAVWNKDYEVYALTYYTAEAMGVTEKIHTALFSAIHTDGRRLTDPETMAMFFSEFGIDPISFAKVYQSFGVRASVQQAAARGRAYRSGGVPAFIVNGKYRVESQNAGSYLEMLKIVNFLVQKERSAT